MNIFASDHNPTLAAQALDDRRLIKMVLETAQILSTATEAIGRYGFDALYKPTHQNHPCTLWAKHSVGNFMWLVQHGFALAEEYQYRFEKQHKSFAIIQTCMNCVKIGNFPQIERTQFVNCTKFNLDDPILAYRACLQSKWHDDGKAARWTKRGAPSWKL